jgi:hypothetical protein
LKDKTIVEEKINSLSDTLGYLLKKNTLAIEHHKIKTAENSVNTPTKNKPK